jgi:hypothetical protein
MESFMTNHYLVAKYISSPVRMEPRNIGVFVQYRDVWRARFLGENAEGRLDLRRVRGVVEHTGAYEQWVAYWRHAVLSTPADRLPTVLAESSRVNFVVSEGAGLFLAPDAIENPERTLDHLYHLVVGEFPEQRAEELSLSQRVEETIRRYDLWQNPCFRESPTVRCEIGDGAVEHVRPSYGYVNGRQVYFQKVSINPYRPEITQKEVHNAAWIFERLRAGVAARETSALVKIIALDVPIDPIPFSTPEYVHLLTTLANVVDVDDDAAMERAFAPLAA